MDPAGLREVLRQCGSRLGFLFLDAVKSVLLAHGAILMQLRV